MPVITHLLPSWKKHINQDIVNVSRWDKTNKLTINPTKSHLLVVSPYSNKPSPDALITLDSSILKVEKSIKYLDINVDNQLLFGNCINQLRTTISHAIGIMTKMRQFVPLGRDHMIRFFAQFVCMKNFGPITSGHYFFEKLLARWKHLFFSAKKLLKVSHVFFRCKSIYAVVKEFL